MFETAEDILNMPLKVDGDTVVRCATSPTVRRTFKDPEGFARINGRPALALEVSKRIGANIIDTVEQVRAVVEARARRHGRRTIQVSYSRTTPTTSRAC